MIMARELTKHRSTILSIITGSEVPLNAREVQGMARDMNLATVYRGLQYLEENHYVSGFTMVCAKEGSIRYYHQLAHPHKHFLHCEGCHTFFPYEDCTVAESLRKIEEQYNFAVHAHILYFVGLCGSCRAGQKKLIGQSCQ